MYRFLKYVITLTCLGNSLVAQTHTLLFVGTYTAGKPDSGIYVFDFNSKTGALKKLSVVKDIVNPSFLTVSPNGKFLYSCTESKLPQKGSVTSFRIDSVNGQLHFINKQSSEGENPVYVTVHTKNKSIVVANYTEGNVAAFKVNEDGSLNSANQIIQFADSSINKSRQEKAHPHASVFSPDYKNIFFPDLGSDKIRCYAFDTTQLNPLLEKDSMNLKTVLGSGPRHFTFHPNGEYAYCIEELSGTISAYSYSNGRLDSIQRIFSYSQKLDIYASADIHVSPDGNFLYASNRYDSENTISIFSINKGNGKLKLVGHQSTLGDHPRNFTIDPSGKYLLVANLVSNTIVVFKRNSKTGLLSKTKHVLNIPRPSCLLMRIYRN